jgi:hypothetical protein
VGGWAAVAVVLFCAAHAPVALGQEGTTPDTEVTETNETTQATPDMHLEGDAAGTALGSLTVQGENQVQIHFERPALDIELDPGEVPGLEWDRAVEVLDRQRVDLLEPMVRRSAFERSPYLARPWLEGFRSGSVARFRPEVTGVSHWALVVADSRGETVARFEGDGRPPEEINWDGRTLDGSPAIPGLTHSYVFEAEDAAGNKRNFVGQGFEIGAYRMVTSDGVRLVMTGEAVLNGAFPSHRQESLPPPLLLESASWLNQLTDPGKPIRVVATARSFQQAQKLAESTRAWIEPHVIGDAARIGTVTDVRADAPQQGSVLITSVKQ